MEQNELRTYEAAFTLCLGEKEKGLEPVEADRKSTRLNSSHP